MLTFNCDLAMIQRLEIKKHLKYVYELKKHLKYVYELKKHLSYT